VVPYQEPTGLSGEFYHNSEVLKSALLALPTRERKAVVLFFYHDLTHREISDVLEIPLGTVKSRLRSAVRRLREDLLR
jgi:RNA polymerase sigma-70 factor (ECF subfamily)